MVYFDDPLRFQLKGITVAAVVDNNFFPGRDSIMFKVN